MPINGVLDLQRRSLQIGEIRTGTSRAIEGKKGRQPVRLETFRFTTGSKATAEAIAAMYGGQVAPWSERKGTWEVITDRTELQVWVPPRGEAVDANMELWDGPRCLRKCDGIVMSRPQRGPCQCPKPDDPSDPESVEDARNERMRLAAMRPARACKPITRINVSITELPGALGVFKLNTGSEAAAVETADSGDLLALARQAGAYVPAILRISWRQRVSDGKPYPVPVLQIGASMQQIARGELPAGPAGLIAQLAPSGRPALEAGTGTTPAAIESGRTAPEDGDNGPAEPEDWQRATVIYQRALKARSRADVERCFKDAESQGLAEASVCIDRERDEWESLHSALQVEWGKKAAA